MSLLLGVAAASVSALFWGSQFVPLKRMKNPNMLHYNMFMALGILGTSVALTFMLGFPFALNYFGILAGILWNIGNVLHIVSIERIGIAKGTAIPLGMPLIITFLSGTFFFVEPLNIALGAFGVLVFLAGLVLVSQGKEKINADNKGLAAAFFAGLFFGAPAFLFKLSNLGINEFLFPMAAGIIAASSILFLVKVRKVVKNQVKPGMISGFMWSVAMLSSLYAITYLGLAIGAPLTQLALLVGVLWGLFYFKEIKDKKIRMKVILGSAMLFGAGVLLTLAKVFL
ncbi:MAG: hypothetical protein HYW26_00575 [Candidatus Aenigmarchaeota archaeon]|nr:hypothetical protein [Candidatus Aenigmarchaeota archaeon]